MTDDIAEIEDLPSPGQAARQTLGRAPAPVRETPAPALHARATG